MWHSTLTADFLNIKNEVRKELKCSILENGKYTMIKSILRQILCDAIKMWRYTNGWKRKRQPTPVFLPGESRGQGSLMGYSPWDHTELDMTERPTHYTNGMGKSNDAILREIRRYNCVTSILHYKIKNL